MFWHLSIVTVLITPQIKKEDESKPKRDPGVIVAANIFFIPVEKFVSTALLLFGTWWMAHTFMIGSYV
jgi:hypothetical protein